MGNDYDTIVYQLLLLLLLFIIHCLTFTEVKLFTIKNICIAVAIPLNIILKKYKAKQNAIVRGIN